MLRPSIWLTLCFVLLLGNAFAQVGGNDPSFDPGEGASGHLWNIVVDPNGKIWIAGSFITYDGVSRRHIARLNEDGGLDTTFKPGTGLQHTSGDDLYAIVVQPDGKILIGGWFSTYNDTIRHCVARINPDGTLDPTFDPGIGANQWVRTIALQPDGKIIVGGDFTMMCGTPRNGIARLNSDGTLDPTFDPGLGANDAIVKLLLQPDGKILIGGIFTTYNGLPRRIVARINADGTLDPSFSPGLGANFSVRFMALQEDGKVLIVGPFQNFNGSGYYYIVRLDTDGTMDPDFVNVGASDPIYALGVQEDGRIMIGGVFTSINGTTRNRLARLNADGTLDMSFDPGIGANSTIWTLAIQPDLNTLIGGQFTNYCMMPRNHITRVLMQLPTALSETANKVELRIAPNPLSNDMRVLGLDGPGRWTIFDEQARILRSGTCDGFGEQVVNVSSLAAGSYFFVLEDRSGRRATRFSKL